MKFNEKVQAALRHIHSFFPEVTQVFYGEDGRWFFCDTEFNAPDFDGLSGKIDVSMLEDAVNAVDNSVGFPAAYRLLGLTDYHALWATLQNVPVSEGTTDAETDTIDEAFLHFPAGTPRETIWHWFETQHPEFLVGEVMLGLLRPCSHESWTVTLILESGHQFTWVGDADNPQHAESQAIAAATAKTGTKVREVKIIAKY